MDKSNPGFRRDGSAVFLEDSIQARKQPAE
jgi:hypothetical protein